VRNLQSQIERNDKRASAGNAGAIAFASIPQVIETGTSGVGAGTGCYRGECGLAIGASYRTKDGKWILKGGATVDTRGGAGVGAGALFTWK
jgi:autotransporter adhesin